MAGRTRADAAARAGVELALVDELIEAGALTPDAAGSLTDADVRRITILRSMLEAGLPLEGISRGIREGLVSLDFVSSPEYERFRGLSSETFEQASARTGQGNRVRASAGGSGSVGGERAGDARPCPGVVTAQPAPRRPVDVRTRQVVPASGGSRGV